MSKTNAPDPLALGDAIEQFSNNIDGLRDFTAFLTPLLKQRSAAEGRKFVDSLEENYRASLHRVLREHPELQAALENSGRLTELLESKLGNIPEPPEAAAEAVGRALSAAIEAVDLDTLEKATMHVGRLAENVLNSLISASELLLSDILHQYYRLYPDALSGDRSFTLAQLRELQNLDAIIEYAVEDRVEDVLRRSFEDQLKFFRKDLKIDIGLVETYQDALLEIHARRNTIVHAGGKVGKAYLSRVKDTELKIGDSLPVDEDYITRAFDIIELTHVLLAAMAWRKWRPIDTGRDMLVELGFESLQQGRWVVAEAWSLFVMNDEGVSETTRLNARLNYWQSMKWQGNFAAVEQDVKNADFSAVDAKYQLARFALLQDETAFMQLLPGAIVQERIAPAAVRSWPIFREMRELPRFEQELSSAEYLLARVREAVAIAGGNHQMQVIGSSTPALPAPIDDAPAPPAASKEHEHVDEVISGDGGAPPVGDA